MAVLNYIQAKYKRLGFVFIPVNEITNLFGDSARDELNQLKKQGLIRRREGANGPLIEYLPNNSKNDND